MKKFCFKKKWFFSMATNLVIALMIVSVFAICFWTDNSVVVSSTGYKAIYRGNENNKNVSLCINVYWGTEHLDEMLATLKEYNATATFFLSVVVGWQKILIYSKKYMMMAMK